MNRLHIRLAASCAVLAFASGCTSAARLAPTSLAIAGNYATDVSLLSSTCPGVTVDSNPTSVEYSSGTSQIVLKHVGQTYVGRIRPDGSFTTEPRAIEIPGATHTLTISGQFNPSGFDATVRATVTQTAEPRSCSYDVKRTGTRKAS
jgi:hypothetical protein